MIDRPAVIKFRGVAAATRRIGPNAALIGISIVVPALLFVFAAWQNYREVSGEAAAQVERTTRILHEHAVKVFETHRLIIDQINTRLRFVDWSKETDRADLYALLANIRKDFAQVANVAITDANGAMRATARTYPADPTIRFTDRDWFIELAKARPGAIYVSHSYAGRQSGQAIYNFAARAWSADPAVFDGAIAISIDRSYFESFYRTVEPEYDHVVILIRADGAILARDPPTERTDIEPSSPVIGRFRQASGGIFTDTSAVDGAKRIFGYRKVEPYPVYVGFGVDVSSALAPWRRNVIEYAIVAALASLTLLSVSLLAIRRSRRENEARQRWQDAAAALEAEAAHRSRAEEQLRQSQKMEAIGQLTGGLAHDFNNLLTGISGALELLEARIGQGRLTDVPRYVAAAQGASKRAAALTHRLLAFSRRQTLEPRPTDVTRLVAGMDELIRRTMGPGITLEVVTAGGLWPALVDPSQLENALLNLCINARDAMPNGGRITVETANKWLDERGAGERDLPPGQYLSLCVTDTGTGMSPDVIAKAFDPFFTTKPIGEGTGLGLSMIYGFANQSGGQVRIYSEVGQGTTVCIYLPRHYGPTDTVEEAASLSSAPRAEHGETVLIVDDEPTVRMLVTEVLDDLGYAAIEASDGSSGLKVLQSDVRIDLLVTDVGLPGGMNGRQMADAGRIGRPDLKVLFITGYAENALIGNGQLDPGMRVLTKPFVIEALATRISEMIKT